MTGFSLLQSTDLADIVGVCIILSIALGAFSLMWRDYKNDLEENDNKYFRVLDFILKEQLYIFIFLVLAFLIGGVYFPEKGCHLGTNRSDNET